MRSLALSSSTVLCSAAIIIGCLATASPFLAEAQQPAGTRPATAADLPAMRAAGIPNPTVGMAWDPSSSVVGQSVGEAKQYLLSIAKGLPGTKAPPDAAHIAKLNDQFAKCAAAFLKAYSAQYGPVVVRSAYRDGPSGENARAGGAPGSNHTRGVAIDVNPNGGNSSYQTMWRYASQNPKFGVCFPHQDGGANTTGYKDPPHMILASIGGKEAAACTRQGVIKPCDGQQFTPSPVQPGGGDTTTPSSELSNKIREALGMPAPQQPALPPQPSLPAQPSLPSQSPSPQQPTLPAQPTISSEQTPISSFINTNPIAATGSIRVATNSPTIQATSTFELIDAYANPVSDSIDIGTIVPINLNANIKDIAIGLSPTDTNAQNPRAASGTVATQGPFPQQTFTSTDLANSNVSPNASGQNLFLVRLLDTMKNVLIYASNYLKPFGGFSPNQYVE